MGFTRQMSETEIVTALAAKIEALEDELQAHRRSYPQSSGGIATTEARINGKISGVWAAADALHVGYLIDAERLRIRATQRRIA